MTTTLTDEMREALAKHGNEPVYVEDPLTKNRYVLLPKSDYDRLRVILGVDDPAITETYGFQESVAQSEGWDDAIMDEYNNYDQHRKSA